MLNSCPKYMNEGEWLAKVSARRKPLPYWLKKLAAVILFIAAPFIAAALISMLSNNTLEIARYEVKSSKLTGAPVRIVMISDLHRKKLDKTNEQVIKKTALEAPDIIVVNGDMLEPDFTEAEIDAFSRLLERLAATAPVYFTVGNHDFPAFYSEYELGNEYEFVRGLEPSPIISRLESTGARFLERDYLDIELNGNKLRIGGLYAFAYPNPYYSVEQYKEVFNYLSDFCMTDAYKLMLSHRPKSFTARTVNFMWSIDLILAGHTHNGVISLPFGLGAVYASESFFQKYNKGIFGKGDSKLIIGAGIDGYKGIVPRIFNPPELVVVDIMPQE